MRFFLIFFLFTSLVVNAQQDPQFTLLQDRNVFANPSLIVNEHKLNFQGVYRMQWLGFDGFPFGGVFNGSLYVDKARSAFGVTGLLHRLGPETSINAAINYAYEFRIGKHRIIPGMSIGVINKTLLGLKLSAITEYDPNIPTESTSATVFDIGSGLVYKYERLMLGLSSTHLSEPRVKLILDSDSKNYRVARHYYAVASYDALIGKYLRIKPVAFLKSDLASTQFDQFLWLGVRDLSKAFSGLDVGAGYRIDDAIMFGISLNFKWFSISYSYDLTTSNLNAYSQGSHEANLRIHVLRRSQD